MPTRIEESLVSVGQLADRLGCSVRSIYRWEESGVILKPQRIDRGGVSARVYTESEVEEIQKTLHGRLMYTAIVRDVPVRRQRQRPNAERTVMKTRTKPKQQGFVEATRMDERDGPLFLRGIRFAKKWGGCRTLTVETMGGKRRTFRKP